MLVTKLKKLKYSSNRFFRLIHQLLRLCWLGLWLVRNARARAEFMARLNSQRLHYQFSTATELDRYPRLFRQCALYLQQFQSPKILSYGCSTGEEVFSIGKYMPGALVIGTDINKWCIKQCRKNNNYGGYLFYDRLAKEFIDSAGFDAIFCMAVFQRTENRVNKENDMAIGFTFEQFENEIILLDKKLNTGGLLIIDHADFSFTDTLCANRYAPLDFEGNRLLRKRPVFNKVNQKNAELNNNYRVFVKRYPSFWPADNPQFLH